MKKKFWCVDYQIQKNAKVTLASRRNIIKDNTVFFCNKNVIKTISKVDHLKLLILVHNFSFHCNLFKFILFNFKLTDTF